MQRFQTTHIDRADEVFVARQEMRKTNAPDDGEEPGAYEALPCLLGRNLNQLRASKGDTTKVCENVVCDDHGNRQNEPVEALEDVVDDEMSLPDDQEEGHVCPGELCELELVVSLLQRVDEEDEAWHC